MTKIVSSENQINHSEESEKYADCCVEGCKNKAQSTITFASKKEYLELCSDHLFEIVNRIKDKI